jgi:hypothetical protein
MASSKKKKSSKKSVASKKKSKPATQKKPAPKSASKPKVKAKAKAKAKAKPPAKKQPAAKAKKAPTHGDSWGNASLAPKVKAPKITNLEPSGTPPLALHDHEGGLVSPSDESEELAERIHGGEEAVKDADEDTGSPVLDDRDSDGDE